jgi:hypothetical protein
MHVLDLIALALVLITGRLAFVHFWPWRECRWCRPGGVLGGSWLARAVDDTPRRKRRRRCWRCKNKRLTRRWGAWHTHKAADSFRRALEERGSP